MTWARNALLVVALLVAVSLAVSTTGVSSAAVERDVDVAVVSDDDAYLGVQRGCADGTLRVTTTNQFPAGTTLNVDVIVNGTERTSSGLTPGESRSAAFDAFEAGDTITIHASGPGVSVHVRRPLPAGC